MTDKPSERHKSHLDHAHEVRAERIEEIKAKVAGLDRELLIERLAAAICYVEEKTRYIEALRGIIKTLRNDPNRCAPIKIQENDGPWVDALMKKVTSTDSSGKKRVWFEPLYTAEAANAKRAHAIASKGGEGRAAKYKRLEAETIRLYTQGTWASVPDAAFKITPIIVEMSKDGNGELFPSTTKPLEWIRAYNKAQKK